MHILIFPLGFILWYLAYEAKPNINDEVTINWEEKNTNKRNKLLNIILWIDSLDRNHTHVRNIK